MVTSNKKALYIGNERLCSTNNTSTSLYYTLAYTCVQLLVFLICSNIVNFVSGWYSQLKGTGNAASANCWGYCYSTLCLRSLIFNTMRPRHNGYCFILKPIFVWNLLYSNFLIFTKKISQCQKTSIDNVMAWWQAIIWASDSLVYWRIHTSLSDNQIVVDFGASLRKIVCWFDTVKNGRFILRLYYMYP